MKFKFILPAVTLMLMSSISGTSETCNNMEGYSCSFMKVKEIVKQTEQTAANLEQDNKHKKMPVTIEQYKPAPSSNSHSYAASYDEYVRNKEKTKQSKANTPAPKKESLKYVVQKGDTLYQIAKSFDTTVDLLMLENKIVDPTRLQIGQELQITSEAMDVSSWLENNKIEKVFSATLTAYTAGVESTGKKPGHPAYGITSSGAKVKEGRTIAVDPKVIPIGSMVYIEGIGLRKAEDTGSAIKGARIDVFMEDLNEALEFGVQKNKKVYLLSLPEDRA